ncbi:MAG: hypothetical protein ABJN62_07645 [Halioglobus sp.]
MTQCANHKAGAGDHDTCDFWTSGNVNGQKATYFEGDSVAYRMYLEGLEIGETYQMTFQWDATQGDKNALDYVTSYNATVANANPCQGLATALNCANAPSTVAIPFDNVMGRGRGVFSGPPFVVNTGQLAIWGGDTLSLQGGEVGIEPFDYDPDVPAAPTQPPYAVTTKISATVQFVATSSDAIIAWGGHISTRMDWGESNSAINITGSPYHMRLVIVEDMGTLTDAGTFAQGSKDVQLSADAVFFPISLKIVKSTDRASDQSFTFNTNVEAPDDTFQLKNTEMKTVEVASGDAIEVDEQLPNGLWSLDSIECIKLPGAEPMSNSEVSYSNTGVTVTLDEGEMGQCTFNNEFVGVPNLVVDKKVFTDLTTDCTAVNFDDAENEVVGIDPGDTVKYCYRVMNSGDDTAINVSLEDNLGTVDLGDDTSVTLFGGDLAAGNLTGGGGKTYGALQVQMNHSTAASPIINTGTADADNASQATDTAQVNLLDRVECAVQAGVTSDGNCDNAQAVIDVVANTQVTWCADVCWDSDSNYNLTGTSVALKNGEAVLDSSATNPASIAPGACGSASFVENLGGDSVTRTLAASGNWGEASENPETCSAGAAVNVLNPAIDIDKTWTTDNDCSDDDQVDVGSVYSGTDIWYCFVITNTGSETLDNVEFFDTTLGLGIPDAIMVDDGTLAPGESWSYKSSAYNVTSDVMNTARVDGDGRDTATPVDDSDSANVTVDSADVVVIKTGTPSLGPDDSAITYTVTIENIGNVAADSVTLVDPFPSEFEFVQAIPAQAGCLYDAIEHELSCDLGDGVLDPGPGNKVEITISGTLADGVEFGAFDNEACAEQRNDAQYPDVDLSNNCDDTTTRVSPGATRTIGFWQNHPDLLQVCLSEFAPIDLGFVEIRDELFDDDIDAQLSTVLSGNKSKKGRKKYEGVTPEQTTGDDDTDVETALEMALGIFKAKVSQFLDRSKRSHLDQARMQAGRQVLAAFCNIQYLGATPPAPDWLATAAATLASGDRNAILQVGTQADLFNNAGDAIPIGEPSGPANPKAPYDDPTDPRD